MVPEIQSFTSLVEQNKFFVASVALAVLLLSRVWLNKRHVNVPAIGPSGTLTSFIGAFRFIKDARSMLLEGYHQHKVFKVPELTQWNVMICDPKLIEEMRLAKDDQLSFPDAINDTLATRYTLGRNVENDFYHVPIIRGTLTRNIAVVFDDVRDELVAAFADNVDEHLKGDEWVSLPVLDTVMQVVARASNRLFVGLPLCRNEDWTKLNIQFTIEVVLGGLVIRLFPEALKPLAAFFINNVPRSIRRALAHLRPIVEERYAIEPSQRPNDFLSWLMDAAPNDYEKSAQGLTSRILVVNFAAIHTSSNSFTMAFLYLAAEPEKYLAPMREEAERVVNEEGWSKVSMSKMRLLDSFLKESQRMSGIADVSMARKAKVDYTFSNGLFIPKGTTLSVPMVGVHRDSEIYSDPEVFDGFRFANIRDGEGEATKHQYVTTSTNFVPFGHGRHACPGRFFAANELKTMLAHIVLNYDMKLEEEGKRPMDMLFGPSVIPNKNAKVMLRKRQK